MNLSGVGDFGYDKNLYTANLEKNYMIIKILS